MMIFWEYDLFPYCLAAQGEFCSKKSAYYVPNYQMYVSKPLFVMGIKSGMELWRQIKGLKEVRYEAMKIMNEGFDKELKMRAPKIFTQKKS